jgi:hypothetical protein
LDTAPSCLPSTFVHTYLTRKASPLCTSNSHQWTSLPPRPHYPLRTNWSPNRVNQTIA